MGSIKFQVSPSFWCMVVLAILTRQSTAMYFYTIAMVLHELAHYFVAKKLLYQCTKLQVSAFGAVLYGEFEDMNSTHRILVAIAGPLCNILLAVICFALWWLVPDMYYFTEQFCIANLSMAGVNLIPVYPLDGGRILTAFLEKKYSYKKSIAIVRNCAVVLGCVLFALFLLGLFVGYLLFSLGTFAVFMVAGAFGENSDATYRRISVALNLNKRLLLGMENKTLVFCDNVQLNTVITKMFGNYWFTVRVVDSQLNEIACFDYKALEEILRTFSPVATLREVVNSYKGK